MGTSIAPPLARAYGTVEGGGDDVHCGAAVGHQGWGRSPRGEV